MVDIQNFTEFVGDCFWDVSLTEKSMLSTC